MGRVYSKKDVEFHTDGLRRFNYPAVNVKVYHWPLKEFEIMDKFKCSEETANKANEFAYNLRQRMFWDDIQDVAREIFEQDVRVFSAGRSGGWCIVDGLPRFHLWDAVMLGKWRRFEKIAKMLPTKEEIFEDIEANKWYLDGSEEYNFFEGKNGEGACIAEMKQKAKEAGFGPVIK